MGRDRKIFIRPPRSAAVDSTDRSDPAAISLAFLRAFTPFIPFPSRRGGRGCFTLRVSGASVLFIARSCGSRRSDLPCVTHASIVATVVASRRARLPRPANTKVADDRTEKRRSTLTVPSWRITKRSMISGVTNRRGSSRQTRDNLASWSMTV